MKRTILSLIISVIAFAVYAHDFESDGIFYKITNETEKTVGVTYKGSSYSSTKGEYVGAMEIPTMVAYNGNTYSVSSIEESAFRGCSGLTSISISSSVISVGKYSFTGCTGLKELKIEDGKDAISLSYHTYSGSGVSMDYISWDIKGLFYDCPIETLYLGRNISYSYSSQGKSSESPFYNISKMSAVSIGECVTSMCKYCFAGCSGLESVNISNLEKWCQISFDGANSNPLYYAENLYLDGVLLTELKVPTVLNSIKEYSFYNCKGIESIVLHEGITSIGDYAFYGCSNDVNIYAYPLLPPTLNSNAFNSTSYENAILYVSKDVATLYRNDECWKKFVNISATLEQPEQNPVLLSIEYPDGAIIKHLYEYNQTATLNIIPAEDWSINTITFNDVDVTSELDDVNCYITPQLTSDSRISIVVRKNEIPTNVESVSDSEIKVYVRNGVISIIGADDAQESVIYDIYGAILYKGTDKEICLDKKGVFILCIDGKTFKFML